MSKKNTLAQKRVRKALRDKDRGYPDFYSVVANGKYSKLVGQTSGNKLDTMKRLFAKLYMDRTLGMLGLHKPEVAEGEVV